MDWKLRKKILPLVLTLTGSSGSLRDASPHFLQVYKKELVFTQAGGSKTRWQSPPQVQYVSYVFSLLFLTGWRALITVLETWSKDPDWCILSTAWLLEENKYFPESLSPQSSTQVKQAVLLMLQLTCTELGKWHSFGSRGALLPLPAMSVGMKPYSVFTAWGMFLSKNVLSEDQDCPYGRDKYRLKAWEEYAAKRKMLHTRY